VARYWLEEQAGNEKTLLLVNKIDVADPAEATRLIPEPWRGREVALSARTGEGLDRLEALFHNRLGLGPIRPGRPALICQRQAESVRSALARRETFKTSQIVAGLVADLRDSTGIE
jgi:tRNA U34 5-carboxymethylaminomethyl modifying GTPase MnmE/TrmE